MTDFSSEHWMTSVGSSSEGRPSAWSATSKALVRLASAFFGLRSWNRIRSGLRAKGPDGPAWHDTGRDEKVSLPRRAGERERRAPNRKWWMMALKARPDFQLEVKLVMSTFS